eukprot:730269_1
MDITRCLISSLSPISLSYVWDRITASMIRPDMSLEDDSITEGQPRVKFHLHRIGPIPADLLSSEAVNHACGALSRGLTEMERLGAAPVCFDGKVGGNGGVVASIDGQRHLFVSRSGKPPGISCDLLRGDFVLIKSFDRQKWSAEYYSIDETVKPTSDAPLLWFSLMEASTTFSWKTIPEIVLHGHALASESEARALGLPISEEETLFSTLEDLTALSDLMKENPFPENAIWIRKNHGFFMISESGKGAMDCLQTQIGPHINPES